MFPCFGVYTGIQKLIVFPRFASLVDFFQYAFKDIISRANSSDVSVHFFYQSSCVIFIPLDVLDKFYKISLFFKVFVCFNISICIFLLLYSYFCDCVPLHDFTLEKILYLRFVISGAMMLGKQKK